MIALLLAATLAVTPESQIEKFLGEWKAGRVSQSYALMSDDARRAFGEAQIIAYLESRRRVLGDLVEFTKPKPAKEMEESHGVAIFETTLKFRNGSTTAWFIVSGDRIGRFGIELPKGKTATLDERDVMPVVVDLLAYGSREGAAAMSDRFSDAMLAAVEQDRATVRAMLTKVGTILGPLGTYELGSPSAMQDDCREVKGKGKFQYGDAEVTVHVCWADGIWNVKHVMLTPLVTPLMVERMFATLFKGAPKVTCPRDKPFPIDGEITCRVEVAGEKPQNATIRRTSESGWQIVGLTEAPK